MNLNLDQIRKLIREIIKETSLMPGSGEMPTNMPNKTQGQKKQLRPAKNDYEYQNDYEDYEDCENCNNG